MIRAAVEAERERALAVVAAEPELPGEPSPAMREALRTRPVECLRAAIVTTKRNIDAAIRKGEG